MIFNSMYDVVNTKNDSKKIGIELEFQFNPSAVNARQVGLQLLQYKMLSTETNKSNLLEYIWIEGKEKFTGMAAINYAIMHGLNSMYPSILYKPVQADFNVSQYTSLEFSFKPMDIDTLKANKTVIQHLLSTIDILKYNTNPSTGMHLWLDYDFIGQTLDEIKEVIEKLYVFFYKNDTLMDSITMRPDFVSSSNADISTMLGDVFKLNKDAAIKQFIKEKKSFISKFNGVDEQTLYNIKWNKEGVKAFEFRWFHSTSDYALIMSRIAFMVELIEFCKVTGFDDLNEINFFSYIDKDKTKDAQKRIVYNSLANFI